MNDVDCSSIQSRYISAYLKSKGFEKIIEEYAEIFWSKLLQITSNDSCDIFPQTNWIKQTIGFIVNEKLYKQSLRISKMKTSNNVLNFWSLINDCWRQYSHKKFEDLIKSDLFRLLFLYFSHSADDEFLSQISAVKGSIGVYKYVISQIKEIIISS